MFEIHVVPILAAAIATFVASFVWYVMLARQLVALGSNAGGRPGTGKVALELVKNIVLSSAVSYLCAKLGTVTVFDFVSLSVLLWVAFPVLILASSVMYEKIPLKLAAIHAVDWLLKLIITIGVLTFWR